MKSRLFLVLIALVLTVGCGKSESDLPIWVPPTTGDIEAVKQPPEQSAIESVTVRAITSGPNHHFFGYYGISPWNESGTRLVCLETTFQDRMPEPGEPAAICLVDAATGMTTTIAETRAWNFQQGAMLHWNPRNPEHGILYNDRDGESVVSVSLDTLTGEKRSLPRAISAVSHDGRHALSLTYGRLQRLRPVVGYGGMADPNPDIPNPDNDGVFVLDLTTGETRLAVSIATAYELLLENHPELEGHHMWFNHTVFNKNDTRFFFLARAPVRWWDKWWFQTAMLTANLDGSDIREVVPFGRYVSHFDWRNDREIIATFKDGGSYKHVLFSDGEADFRVLDPEFLIGDGHCTFAPGQNWFASDPLIPWTSSRRLLMYNVETGERHIVADVPLGKYKSGKLRCDLHPRWKSTGEAICFDAIDEKTGTRQLHVAELTWR
jgi:hypothetical protein